MENMNCPVCEEENIENDVYQLPLAVKNDSLITSVSICRNCGLHFRNIDYTSSRVKEHFDIVGYVSDEKRGGPISLNR